MKTIKDPKQLNQLLARKRARGKSVGFVPTMGALHKGHLSLVRAANRENDVTVVSIFVNPTQFGPKEDLAKYPRPIHKDLNFLHVAKVDFVLVPSVSAMYPEGLARPLKIKGAKWPKLAKGFCGKFRPGHFQGVVTVVTRLLDVVKPHRLYLGAKDYQQAQILSQLVKDLKRDIKVRIMPIQREKYGLAMSSRNRYLSDRDRLRAEMIYRILLELRAGLKRSGASIAALKAEAVGKLRRYVDKVQYLEIVDEQTLEPLRVRRKRMVALTACFVGKTRLIDNVIIRAS